MLRRHGLAWLLLWVLAACSPPPLHQQQSYVFGTLVEVSVYDMPEPQAREAAAAVLARFDALHRLLHAWQPSELSRLNTALARGERANVPDELAAMLLDARALSARTDGLFDPAIGGLIALWGFQADVPQERMPDAAEIQAWAAKRPRMTDLHIEKNTVWSDNPAVRIDLGGYAKGRALDDAVAILKAHGIRNALVNIGGNVIALGQHGQRPWRVGIQHPRQAGTLATLDLHDGEAIGTSGDYQRFFEAGGRRYSHLIDPRTGWPASNLQSVTILVAGAHAGTRSDAFSKPLFIDGEAGLAAHAARLGIASYLAVDAAGGLHVSPAMKARLR
ncbi:MAG TPA: FAD:protein FMN transferase [Thiobacillaceae bacterium]|nr:FAD:protein FMN transferase [Thiobacillaceae bacterium]